MKKLLAAITAVMFVGLTAGRRVVLGPVTGMVSVAIGGSLLGLLALISGIVPLAYADSELVRTESGKVRCDVQPDRVGCQYLPGFSQAPIGLSESQCRYTPCPGGLHWDIANVTAAGTFTWMNGNIPGAHPENDLVLSYGQTYHLQGWTINPAEDGTRFTNDRTGHGMFVSIDNVYSF